MASLNRDAGYPPPVRREHRRGDRGRQEKIAKVQAQLPVDVKMEVIRDQSNYIYEALHEINKHLMLGSILACLVVLLFMRNWRATIIAAVAIPASVIAAFGMMKALGFTLNSVTMLALVLMVGIVIDDAIVVLENIFRFIEEKKMRPFEAAREAATAEIGLAVMATTLSLVVIFVPVSFMSSISGRFLYQFGITSAVAVLVSLLVSFTLTPMMSARLLRGATNGRREGPPHHTSPSDSRGGFYHWIDRVLHAVLGWPCANAGSSPGWRCWSWRRPCRSTNCPAGIPPQQRGRRRIRRQRCSPPRRHRAGRFDQRSGIAHRGGAAQRPRHPLRAWLRRQRLSRRREQRQLLCPAGPARRTHLWLETAAAMAALARVRGQLHAKRNPTGNPPTPAQDSRHSRPGAQSADLRRRRPELRH
jgi:hypothetical protein